jgi:L-rhamnose mutarotase
MTRQCLLLDLVNDADLIAAYRRWHAPGNVPSAVISSIRRRGIREMQIWNAGDRLVMIVETGSRTDADIQPVIDATNPDVVEWETLMDKYQRRLAFSDPQVKWVTADQIFDLADHSG